MVNVTLSLTDELKGRMDGYPEINWSEVARQAFMQKIKDLEIIKEFRRDSTMTDADAIKFGKELRKRVAGKLRGRRA